MVFVFLEKSCPFSIHAAAYKFFQLICSWCSSRQKQIEREKNHNKLFKSPMAAVVCVLSHSAEFEWKKSWDWRIQSPGANTMLHHKNHDDGGVTNIEWVTEKTFLNGFC